MIFLKKIMVAGFMAALVAGCGLSHRTMKSPASAETASNPAEYSEIKEAVSGYAEAHASLMQAYRDWKGTPYRLGGASSSGVDCSSFVRIVMDQYFGIRVPRTTVNQINAGLGIRRASVRTGDLVFFRTGRKTLHVGIIVEGDEFLHASTSRGVMISRLSASYWSSRYFTARRVM